MFEKLIADMDASAARRRAERRENMALMMQSMPSPSQQLMATTGTNQFMQQLGNQGKSPVDNAGKGGGNLDSWINQAMGVLGMNLDPNRRAALATLIKRESSGNPRAINNWDSNAKRGDPSRGLMQTIGATFNRYKLPGHDDIYDPVSNIIAGMRYINSRYGDLMNVPSVKSGRGGY